MVDMGRFVLPEWIVAGETAEFIKQTVGIDVIYPYDVSTKSIEVKFVASTYMLPS